MKEITRDDIIKFILYHSDDTDMMDKINKISYPFTSRYIEWANQQKRIRKTESLEDTLSRLSKYD